MKIKIRTINGVKYIPLAKAIYEMLEIGNNKIDMIIKNDKIIISKINEDW